MDIQPGADLRRPELRREVWQRFYTMHLQLRAHPGGVYYLIPYLRDRLGWDTEDTLFFCLLNGNTQHPMTSLLLMEAYKAGGILGVKRFWRDNYQMLEFDTDRRHHKSELDTCVESYQMMVRGSGTQERFWSRAAKGGWESVWKAARSIYSFGRLSAFSYSEYLAIAGVPFECNDLMLEDRAGSRSHRNGLCIVTGRDEYDWHQSNPAFDGRYDPVLIRQLTREAEGLLEEAHNRNSGKPWIRDVGYFTMESALCTYKSWHRPNRRYPNVYNDMMYDRIRKFERRWGAERSQIFWEARQDCLPARFRLEDNPFDPGLTAVKQNYYRETGKQVMMGYLWPELRSDFDADVEAGAFGEREDK